MPDFPDPETQNVLAPDCRRCPALVDARERISWGQGSSDANLVVVGEAPAAGDPSAGGQTPSSEPSFATADEDADQWRGGNHTGMAYTTRHCGRRVRDLAAALGHPDAYFTNAVKCHPPENRDPTPDERSNCRGHLETELDAVEPAAVLTTGKHATASLLSMADRSLDGFVAAVGDCVRDGRPLDWPGFSPALVPALHPSYSDIWIGRLDLTRDEYTAGLRTALDEAGARD